MGSSIGLDRLNRQIVKAPAPWCGASLLEGCCMGRTMGGVAGKTVLVTGANRGIGRAFVEEALRRGAGRVYAGTRGPIPPSDDRVVPVRLDVTDAAQIREAVANAEWLDMLINNAGIALYDDL